MRATDDFEGRERMKEARQTCIERQADCKGCLHALESMGWTCAIKNTVEVRKTLRQEPCTTQKFKGNARRTEAEIWAILDDLARGLGRGEIEAKYKIDKGNLSRIANGKMWPEVFKEWQLARKESA